MGPRVGMLASLVLLGVGACGGPGAATSSDPLDRVGDIAPVDASIAATSDVAVTGRCLGGKRLVDDRADLSAALGRFGTPAYDQLADDPVWTDQVDCADPHGIEIYAAVRLPDDVDSQVSSYGDLLDPTSAVRRSVDAAIDHECALAIGPAGRVMAHVPIDLDVVPAVAEPVGALTWEPVPAAAWDDGDHAFGCLFEQPSPTTTMVADLTSPSLPEDDRLCVSGSDFVSCSQPHDAERVAVLTVDRAVAAAELTGAAAVNPAHQVDLGSTQWAALDHVCQRYLAAVDATLTPGIRGVANTYPDFYPDADGHYTIVCSARSRFGTPVRSLVVTAHSVFNGG